MSFAEAFTSRSFPADAIAADASNRFHPQEATWEGTFRTDRSFSGGGVLIFHHGDGGSSSRRDSPLKHELRQYSEEEWNAMYPHIKRLYMAERRNLHEVVQLMRREHGFNATYVLSPLSFSHPFQLSSSPLPLALSIPLGPEENVLSSFRNESSILVYFPYSQDPG